jgi:hypothetical protein
MQNVLEELLRVYRAQYPLVHATVAYCAAGDVLAVFGRGEATVALLDHVPDSLALRWYHRRKIGVEYYPIALEPWLWMHDANKATNAIQQVLITDAKGYEALWLESSGFLQRPPILIPSDNSLLHALTQCTLCIAAVGASEFQTYYQSLLPKDIIATPALDSAGNEAYRVWYLLNGEPRVGPGSGFIAFARGVRGQKIIAKAGIKSAIPQDRLVQLHSDDLVFSPTNVQP